jgi:bifunctional UDP-N-acetylglucosamine pyrophosphorylase/glucosamine-1-phosphate N-acetyltransferase
MKTRAILLAAGKGTRMRSRLPKLLHPLGGRAMILHSLQAASGLGDGPPLLVVGHGAEELQAAVGDQAEFAIQAEQLGTGHAVMQARQPLEGKADLVLVANADLPLMRAETFKALIEAQRSHSGPFTMLTVIQDDPRGFGRILRGEQGQVLAIVEEAEASPEQLALRELNVGVYCFRANWLWPTLEKISPSANKGEYYLTDLLEIAVNEDLAVNALVLEDAEEAIGVNTREHLAQAEAALRRRINRHWMLEGVTIVDPQSTYIAAAVTLGQDTTIWPNTILEGDTHIGAECTLGPNTVVRDSRIGDHCRVEASFVEHAVLEHHVDIGPFAHLRKGAHLAEGAHMGNFGEIKNSTLGPGSKMGHFSYLGDATVGANVNIGAGTITCNYDGVKKNHTEIADDVFIGSDTMLVAPLKIGAGARTGAGAVVTKDVPAGTLVVGMPARAIRKVEKKD